MKFRLTPGQTHDVTQAESMLEGIKAEHILMDKVYDSAPLVALIEKSGAQAVIPPVPIARLRASTTARSTANATRSNACSGD